MALSNPLGWRATLVIRRRRQINTTQHPTQCSSRTEDVSTWLEAARAAGRRPRHGGRRGHRAAPKKAPMTRAGRELCTEMRPGRAAPVNWLHRRPTNGRRRAASRDRTRVQQHQHGAHRQHPRRIGRTFTKRRLWVPHNSSRRAEALVFLPPFLLVGASASAFLLRVGLRDTEAFLTQVAGRRSTRTHSAGRRRRFEPRARLTEYGKEEKPRN